MEVGTFGRVDVLKSQFLRRNFNFKLTFRGAIKRGCGCNASPGLCQL